LVGSSEVESIASLEASSNLSTPPRRPTETITREGKEVSSKPVTDIQLFVTTPDFKQNSSFFVTPSTSLRTLIDDLKQQLHVTATHECFFLYTIEKDEKAEFAIEHISSTKEILKISADKQLFLFAEEHTIGQTLSTAMTKSNVSNVFAKLFLAYYSLRTPDDITTTTTEEWESALAKLKNFLVKRGLSERRVKMTIDFLRTQKR